MATFEDWLDRDEPDDPFGTRLTKGALRLGRPLHNLYRDTFLEDGDIDHAPPSSPGPMENMYKPQDDDLMGPPAPEGWTPPRDPDAEMKEYIRKASQAPPSERMYEEYISNQPREEQFQKGGFWRGLGSVLAGLGGRPEISRALTHPGYERAYRDWATEGKYLNVRGRAADAARERELGAEKFGIELEGKKRGEAIASQKAAQAAIHQQEVDKRNEEREARIAQREADLADYRARTERRAEATASRAESAAARAESREERAERLAQEREDKARKGELKGTYESRSKEFESELKGIEDQVTKEFLADPNNEEHIDPKSNRLSPEARATIAREVVRRKKKMESSRPMAVELDPNEVKPPEALPEFVERPERAESEELPDWYTEKTPWYSRLAERWRK